MIEINSYGKIVAISVSEKRGQKKTNVLSAELREGHGIVGDAHADGGRRQVSLLALESIQSMQERGADVAPGDFAENITTEGINFSSVSLGDHLKIGNEAVLVISKIGKECHGKCQIYDQIGHCVMPEEGVFVTVIKGGNIKENDSICLQRVNVNV